MINLQYDLKRLSILKDLFLRFRDGESVSTIRADFDIYFNDVDKVEILLIIHELLNGNYGITMEDVKKLNLVSAENFVEDKMMMDGHPIQIFKKENKTFEFLLHQIKTLLETIKKEPQPKVIEDVIEQMSRLGGLYSHYNRKEKLFFPIMERYGHYALPRIMWKADDRIRGLYQAAKRRIERLPNIDIQLVLKTYDDFEMECKEMLFQEEFIVLPVVLSIFQDEDYIAIANESDAFGYALMEPEEPWKSEQYKKEKPKLDNVIDLNSSTRNLPFGGGYLTLKEVNLIMNHLPLEITFVDKNGIFKYFNERINYADMILVRTPTSVGRNVANCHPPKSMKKVMRLIRDLKTKKRTSETMWFKKGEHYVHITYTGVFDDNGEYLGILECVQDIQPFVDLPRDTKRGISRLEE